MYFPSWSQKLLHDLFPWRHIARRFRPNTIHYDAGDIYTTPLQQPIQSHEPIIEQELSVNPLDYQVMDNPYELPEPWFEEIHNTHEWRTFTSSFTSVSPVLGQEAALTPPTDPNLLEISQAINEVKGMDPGLDGLLQTPLPLEASPAMDLEARIDDPFMNSLADPLFGPPAPF